MRAVSDDAPVLHDLMPWSVRPLRIAAAGRWPPNRVACGRVGHSSPASRTSRPKRRCCTRPAPAARTPRFAQLPGHHTRPPHWPRGRPLPQPVRVQHGPFDQQWLIPDHRLIDVARPELWRVADEQQVFSIEQPRCRSRRSRRWCSRRCCRTAVPPPGSRRGSGHCSGSRAAGNPTWRPG